MVNTLIDICKCVCPCVHARTCRCVLEHCQENLSKISTCNEWFYLSEEQSENSNFLLENKAAKVKALGYETAWYV